MPIDTAAAPRVLILTASVGAGHLRAAEAVQLALKHLSPHATVRNVDLMACATSAFRQAYSKWYLDLVSKAPHLLGYFYDLTDRPPSKSVGDQIRRMVQRANLKKLNPILAEPWDIIVNTHFLPAEIIARLRDKQKSPQRPGSTPSRPALAPQFTVVTDFDAHGLWVNVPTDRYFVATEEAALSLGRWGVDRGLISITGIPIDPVFAQPKDAKACRARHALSDDRPVVLLLAGGFGVGPIEQLFAAALQVERPVHLAVVCGKNETLKKSIERINVPARHKATVLGFTREMDELMAAADVVVSKPGGLTTSEILARGAAMIIVNPIPGQESRNSDYLLEHGAAIKANSASVLAHKLNLLLVNDSPAGRLNTVRANAKTLAHPQAAIDVAKAVLDAAASNENTALAAQ